MKLTEYAVWDWRAFAKALLDNNTDPKTLYTYQETKIAMHQFSGLSIHTCPGSSQYCRDRCYDARGIKVLMGGTRAMAKSAVYSYLAETNPAELERRILKDLDNCTKVIRVHVGGDFLSVDHIKAWQNIADKASYNTFYAYTRSWRDRDMMEQLILLNMRENFTVFASVDPETGLPTYGGLRVAQMGGDVFNIAKSIRCPEQAGKQPNCARCGLCFNKDVSNAINFDLHGSGAKKPSLLQKVMGVKTAD